MPGHSLATSTARPAQRSLVVLHPTGYVKAGALLLGSGLLVVAALQRVLGYPLGRSWAAGLLGVGLLLWAGRNHLAG